MTPELEAALAFSDMMGTDKHYLGGPAVNEAIVALAAEVRRREAMSCSTCAHLHSHEDYGECCTKWIDDATNFAAPAVIRFCGAWEKRDDAR